MKTRVSTRANFVLVFLLVEILVSKFAQCFSFKFHWLIEEVVDIFLNGLTFDGFTANSARQHPSFHAHWICTFCNVALFFGFPTPNNIPSVENRVFCAFKRWTCGRTSFWLSQQIYLNCQIKILCFVLTLGFPLLIWKPYKLFSIKWRNLDCRCMFNTSSSENLDEGKQDYNYYNY